MQLPLKILFLDDHVGLRDGLGAFLMNKNSSLKFYYAGSKDEAEKILSEERDVKISIIDINLNGVNGLDFISGFRKICPDLNVIVYSMFNDYIHIEQALQKNVQGFISKDAPLDEIEKAILSVAGGGLYYNRTTREAINSMFKSEDNYNENANSVYSIAFDNYKTLSSKEKKIFELLARQKEVYEIARILGRAEKTINNQTSIIYQKLNVHNRLELIKIARILGVII